MSDLKEKMLAAKENSSAVLKMRLILLKSKTSKNIFVFEGVDDKTVYSRWIKVVCSSMEHEFFVCGGKKKLIALKKVVEEDNNNLSFGVYFCLDRDFDDVGVNYDASTYITGAYSFENYLVSEDVLYEILRDDFHCHEDPDLIKYIVGIFTDRKKEFYEIVNEINFKIYFGIKNNLTRKDKLPDRIGKLATITLESVGKNYSNIDDIVQFLETHVSVDDETLRIDFNKLNPEMDFRGKYNFLFFKKIIELLYEDINSKDSRYFNKVLKDGWKPKLNIELENIAARAKPPQCFKRFIEKIIDPLENVKMRSSNAEFLRRSA